MKIDRKKLQDALKIAVKIAGKGSSFPILHHVMLDGPAQQLIATDLSTTLFYPLEIEDYEKTVTVAPGEVPEDMLEGLKKAQLEELGDDYGITWPKSATVKVIKETILKASKEAAEKEAAEADTTYEEKFCLNAADLKKIIDSLDEEKVEIAINEQAITVLSPTPFVTIGNNFQDMATGPVEEYPVIDRHEFAAEKTTVVTVAREGIKNLVVAMATEEAGFKLDTAYFHAEEEQVVTTDGHRLHIIPGKYSGASENFLMPGPYAKLIAATFPDEDIEIHSEGEAIAVSLKESNAVIQGRAMESKFPDYQAVIPDPTQSVIITKKDVVASFKQALILCDGAFQGVRMKINGGIDVSLHNPEKGSYQRANIPCKGTAKEEVEIGINAKYFLQAVNTAKEGDTEIEVGFTDDKSPLQFKHGDFFALLMPMRI